MLGAGIREPDGSKGSVAGQSRSAAGVLPSVVVCGEASETLGGCF